MTLESKTVLLTGAGSGIGRAIALSLAHAGHRVYASMRDVRHKNSSRADALLRFAQEGAIPIQVLDLDVLSEVGCRAAVDRIVSETDRLDVVVTCCCGIDGSRQQAPPGLCCCNHDRPDRTK